MERLNQEDILSTFHDSLQSQQTNNSDLRDRLVQLEQVEASLHEYAYILHSKYDARKSLSVSVFSAVF